MTVESVFREASAEPRVAGLPFSHLSIELGHLYMEDFELGEPRMHEHFRQLRPWVAAARQACAEQLPPGRTPRISTCFLVDDYFTRFSSPIKVLTPLVRIAEEYGLEIDYLARESACAFAGSVSPARLVEDRMIPEPALSTNGGRPPTKESGWLTNGRRSPHVDANPAMDHPMDWQPPHESLGNRHSIFLDVELWDGDGAGRTWSCPFLAATWQLLRLGALRHLGQPVAQPEPWSGDFPDDWEKLPPVIQLSRTAKPFSAYRTLSMLSPRFMPVEHAVRLVLSQFGIDHDIRQQVEQRYRSESLDLPGELVQRVEYVFTGPTSVIR